MRLHQLRTAWLGAACAWLLAVGLSAGDCDAGLRLLPSPGSYPCVIAVVPGGRLAVGERWVYTVDGAEPTAAAWPLCDPILLTDTTTVRVGVIDRGGVLRRQVGGTYTISSVLATARPVASPGSGTYAGPVTVGLSTPTSGAGIRYTMDGSEPTWGSPRYTAPLTIRADTTLRARAFGGVVQVRVGRFTVQLPAVLPSGVMTARYVIAGQTQQVATPVIAPATGTYQTALSAMATTATAGAELRYRLDGADPTSSDPLVPAAGVAVQQSLSLTVRAFRTGWTPSTVARATYALQVPEPVIAPASGLAHEPLSAVVTAAADLTLRYTRDGTDPTTDSALLTGPLPIDQSTQLRVRAYRTGWEPSSVAVAAWTLQPLAPVSSIPGGSYVGGLSPVLICATSGVQIHATLDGSTPTAASPVVTGALALPGSCTLQAVATRDGWLASPVLSVSYVLAVPAPTISLASGTYPAEQQVTLSDAMTAATIRYTLDGTDPTAASPQVSGPITIDRSAVLTARGFRSGYAPSAAATATYTLQVQPVTADVAAGSYVGAHSVTLATATAGAAIRYTLDGSDPTDAATALVASGPIVLPGSVVLRAVATRSGWQSSAAFQAAYTLQVPTPTITPVSGTATAPFAAEITVPNGFPVFYTVDGSIPTVASNIYAGPITINQSCTLNAIAMRSGWQTSSTAAATWNFQAQAPVVDIATGTFTQPQVISLTTPTSGAKVFFTLDGSDPGTSATAQTATGPIAVNQSLTLRAVSARTGWTTSEPLEVTYTLAVATPTLDLTAGTYENDLQVNATTTSPEATMLYTLDSSDPATSTTARVASGHIAINQSCTLTVIGLRSGWKTSASQSAVYSLRVGSVTASLPGGTYTGAQAVALTSATAGSAIHYTLDGSTPSAASPIASTPILLSGSCELRAIALRSGWVDGPMLSIAYTLVVPTPTLTPPAGSYDGLIAITAVDTDAAAILRYTLDGSIPTIECPVLAKDFSLDHSATITIVAFRDGWNPSIAVAATYALRVAAPVASIAAGTYLEAQHVVLSSTTAGAVIRYTLDGSDPSEASPVADASITIDRSLTMCARAFREGWAPSDKLVVAYVVQSASVTIGFPEAAITTSPYGMPLRLVIQASGPTIEDISVPVSLGGMLAYYGWLDPLGGGAYYDEEGMHITLQASPTVAPQAVLHLWWYPYGMSDDGGPAGDVALGAPVGAMLGQGSVAVAFHPNEAPTATGDLIADPNPATIRHIHLSWEVHDDGGADQLRYTWSVLSGPPGARIDATGNSNEADATLHVNEPGVYAVQCVAEDQIYASSFWWGYDDQPVSASLVSDVVQVVVNIPANQAPVATQSPTAVVNETGTSIALRWDGVSDDYGPGQLSYTWRVASGPAAYFSENGTATAFAVSATPSGAGDYVFECVAADEVGTGAAALSVLASVRVHVSDVLRSVIARRVDDLATRLNAGSSVSMTVVLYNQFYAAKTVADWPGASVVWSMTGGVIGADGIAVLADSPDVGLAEIKAVVTDAATTKAALYSISINKRPVITMGPVIAPISPLRVAASLQCGDDDRLSSLVVHWRVLGQPGAQVEPTGVNAARSAVIGLESVGPLQLICEVADPGGLVATRTLDYDTTPTPAEARVSSTSISEEDIGVWQFDATVTDQYGLVMANPGCQWDLVGPGSLNATGLYTPSGEVGAAIVTMTIPGSSIAVSTAVPGTSGSWSTPVQPGETLAPPTGIRLAFVSGLTGVQHGVADGHSASFTSATAVTIRVQASGSAPISNVAITGAAGTSASGDPGLITLTDLPEGELHLGAVVTISDGVRTASTSADNIEILIVDRTPPVFAQAIVNDTSISSTQMVRLNANTDARCADFRAQGLFCFPAITYVEEIDLDDVGSGFDNMSPRARVRRGLEAGSEVTVSRRAAATTDGLSNHLRIALSDWDRVPDSVRYDGFVIAADTRSSTELVVDVKDRAGNAVSITPHGLSVKQALPKGVMAALPYQQIGPMQDLSPELAAGQQNGYETYSAAVLLRASSDVWRMTNAVQPAGVVVQDDGLVRETVWVVPATSDKLVAADGHGNEAVWSIKADTPLDVSDLPEQEAPASVEFTKYEGLYSDFQDETTTTNRTVNTYTAQGQGMCWGTVERVSRKPVSALEGLPIQPLDAVVVKWKEPVLVTVAAAEYDGLSVSAADMAASGDYSAYSIPLKSGALKSGYMSRSSNGPNVYDWTPGSGKNEKILHGYQIAETSYVGAGAVAEAAYFDFINSSGSWNPLLTGFWMPYPGYYYGWTPASGTIDQTHKETPVDDGAIYEWYEHYDFQLDESTLPPRRHSVGPYNYNVDEAYWGVPTCSTYRLDETDAPEEWEGHATFVVGNSGVPASAARVLLPVVLTPSQTAVEVEWKQYGQEGWSDVRLHPMGFSSPLMTSVDSRVEDIGYMLLRARVPAGSLRMTYEFSRQWSMPLRRLDGWTVGSSVQTAERVYQPNDPSSSPTVRFSRTYGGRYVPPIDKTVLANAGTEKVVAGFQSVQALGLHQLVAAAGSSASMILVGGSANIVAIVDDAGNNVLGTGDDKIRIVSASSAFRKAWEDPLLLACTEYVIPIEVGSKVPAKLYHVDLSVGSGLANADQLADLGLTQPNGAYRMKEALKIFKPDVRCDVPKYAECLPKRLGTADEPVIIMTSGGDKSVNGCSLVGWDKDGQNEWTFTAKKDLPFTGDTSMYSIVWDVDGGQVTSGSVGSGTSGGNDTITVKYHAGRHIPKLRVYRKWDTKDELGVITHHGPELVGKAEIHALSVYSDTDDGHFGWNFPSVQEVDLRGTQVWLKRYEDEGTDVNVHVKVDAKAQGSKRSRMSDDGYPQNEYWVKDDDGADLSQPYAFTPTETKKLWVQGYGAPSTAIDDLSVRIKASKSYGDDTTDAKFTTVLVEAGVDASRDQHITFDGVDHTSVVNPYRFWLNNNRDARGAFTSGFSYIEEDDVEGEPNSVGNTITCQRDLEDFTRYWVSISNRNVIGSRLRQGDVKMQFRIRPRSGSPQVKVFLSADPKGDLGYLTDYEGIGTQQVEKFGSPDSETGDRPLLTDNQKYRSVGASCGSGWTDLNIPGVGNMSEILVSDENAPDNMRALAPFLFEGVVGGVGDLEVRLIAQLDGSDVCLGHGRVTIDLRDIKQFYEQWTLGDTPLTFDSQTPRHVVSTLAYSDNDKYFSDQKYLLYVHGWNMSAVDKDVFANTAYKRLWWNGFKGRFGALRWPTDNGFTSWYDPIIQPQNYDGSELCAWQTGERLALWLPTLSADNHCPIDLLGHSMGNIVIGNALNLLPDEQNAVVGTYIASQAAVPGQLYNPSAARCRPWPWSILGPWNTPNVYRVGRFSSVASNFSIANFYNPNDYALASGVSGANQRLKPDAGRGNYLMGPNGYEADPAEFRDRFYNKSGLFTLNMYLWDGLDVSNTVRDEISNHMFLSIGQIIGPEQGSKYYIMSYLSESRYYPLGASPNLLFGSRDVALGRDVVWPMYPSKNYSGEDPYAGHRWHSGQFRMTMPEQKEYWKSLIRACGYSQSNVLP